VVLLDGKRIRGYRLRALYLLTAESRTVSESNESIVVLGHFEHLTGAVMLINEIRWTGLAPTMAEVLD